MRFAEERSNPIGLDTRLLLSQACCEKRKRQGIIKESEECSSGPTHTLQTADMCTDDEEVLWTVPFLNSTAYFHFNESSKWFKPRSQVQFAQPTGTINHDVFDKDWYWRTAKKMKRFAYDQMSAEAVAGYVLKTMGAEDARNVLIVTNGFNDYQELTIELGLDGLGINTTVVRETTVANRECSPVKAQFVPIAMRPRKQQNAGHHRTRHESKLPSASRSLPATYNHNPNDYLLVEASAPAIAAATYDRRPPYNVHGMQYGTMFSKLRHRSRYVETMEEILDEIREHRLGTIPAANHSHGNKGSSTSSSIAATDGFGSSSSSLIFPNAEDEGGSFKPLYDAVIYTFFIMAPPVPQLVPLELEYLFNASKGKLAVIHGSDSWYEHWPSVTLPKRYTFFSRDMRHDQSLEPPQGYADAWGSYST